jgi:hypothetical protein
LFSGLLTINPGCSGAGAKMAAAMAGVFKAVSRFPPGRDFRPGFPHARGRRVFHAELT